MPDFWTHILGGELIQNRLQNEKWQKMLDNHQQLYNFGCQGPDFLFYNDFWPWLQHKRGGEAGKQLHKQNVQSFWLTSLDYLKKKQEQNHPGFSLLATYLSGMIAHYALDKTAHPFINAHAEKFPAHKQLEANLDVYLFQEYRNTQVYKLSPVQTINLGNRLPLIVNKYYQQILAKVHNLEEKINFIDDSYQDFKQVLSFFYTPSRLKVPGIKLIDLIFPMNLSLFIYPKQPDYTLLKDEEFIQFKEIFETGIKEGTRLIKTTIAYLNNETSRKKLTEEFPNTTFDGIEN